jgi:pyruvate/2-oxoglutarate dehydrogenase complex dihydrolipoamide acyltransferase (E2) component
LLLTLTLPRIIPAMTSGVIEAIHAEVGASMKGTAKLLDVSVDLSAVAPQDCPPVSLYRLVVRDHVWLRTLAVAPGDEVPVGAQLAQFTAEADEPLDVEPARQARITIAGIVFPADAWSGRRP